MENQIFIFGKRSKKLNRFCDFFCLLFVWILYQFDYIATLIWYSRRYMNWIEINSVDGYVFRLRFFVWVIYLEILQNQVSSFGWFDSILWREKSWKLVCDLISKKKEFWYRCCSFGSRFHNLPQTGMLWAITHFFQWIFRYSNFVKITWRLFI